MKDYTATKEMKYCYVVAWKHAKWKKSDAKDYVACDNLYEMSRKGKSTEGEHGSVVAWDWEWKQELTWTDQGETCWADGSVLKLDCGYAQRINLLKLIELYT